ncbi:MAG: type II toxin-antitoxin system VapC family toxin, partial [Candidatus Heimdallarchaeota archaeon]
VLNVLRYKRDMGQADLLKVCQSMNDLQLSTFHPDEEYGEKIVQIAFQRGITVYDASYVALAQIRDCLLFTADEKLRNQTIEENCVKKLLDYEVIRKEIWKFPERMEKSR